MFREFHQTFLKLKIKSLNEESRLIRQEEKRRGGLLRNRLHEHRVEVLRRELRATQLAYAYLRGRALVETENKSKACWHRQSAFNRARQIVKAFGTSKAVESFEQWLATGVEQYRTAVSIQAEE